MPYHSPISNRSPEPNTRQLLTLLSLFLGFIAVVFLISLFLVNQLVNWIPVGLERKLGAAIIPVFAEQSQPSTTQTQLNQLLDELTENLTDGNQRDYGILYIPDSTINALAIPGDVIVIYQGLLETVASENELMMILGHELGHFAHRDHLRRLGNGIMIKLLLSYFLGDIQVISSGIDWVNLIVNAQFSQQQEINADNFGLDLLNQHYGHVAGATDFFMRLPERKTGVISFFASHPVSSKRIKSLENRIKQQDYTLGEKKPLFTSISF